MSSYPRKGFTVIELLVAVGVTALLVTLMVNIVTTVLSNWNRTSGALSSGNQARLVLDQLSQDLQGAILKTDNNVWFAASIQQSAGPYSGRTDESWPAAGKPLAASTEIAPSGLRLEDYRFGRGGVWLRFFSIPSGENDGTVQNISAPRAISYQIIRRQVGDADSGYAYQLFRSEVLPNLTFEAGYDLYNQNSVTGNTYNLKNTNPSKGDKETVRRPVEMDVIASGIVDFGIRIFVKDTNNVDPQSDMVEAFPIDRTASLNSSAQVMAFAAAATTPTVPDPAGATPIKVGFPVAAEIMIRVLTPEGIRLLEAHEGGLTNLGDWWDDIVIPNSQVYTRRIDIKSTAL